MKNKFGLRKAEASAGVVIDMATGTVKISHSTDSSISSNYDIVQILINFLKDAGYKNIFIEEKRNFYTKVLDKIFVHRKYSKSI
jgi:hypothetical protein